MTKGCLIVHGLTASPATVAPLADALLKEGYRVATPLLAGHNGTLDDVGHSTWQQWYETVRVAYRELRRNVDVVYYAGLSLGALLGIKLAADEGWGVRAFALLSTPLTLSRWNNFLIPLARFTPLHHLIASTPKNWKHSVGDPEGLRMYQNSSFARFPSRAAFQLAELQGIVRRELPRVKNPLLLVHATQDRVSPYRNVALVQKLAGSETVDVTTLTHSQHVITLDAEKDAVAKAVIQFFKRH
ncbi:MAG: alpha/beta fold hydrolase [Deltaproteobacteria bacterium]|nr:alpha/beta fold hydrolase [Deltaproteobacteria bacterium]